MGVPNHIEAFWRRFLDSRTGPKDANERFYESFRVGNDDESANEGARLILSNEKCATSSLQWEYEDCGKPLPRVGALSVVEDARRRPQCVVETTWVEVIPFGEVDATFAYDYGEGDRTLEGWYRVFGPYYAELCEETGRELSSHTALVCERFRVIFPERPAAAGQDGLVKRRRRRRPRPPAACLSPSTAERL